MKHFIIIPLMLGMGIGAFAQTEPLDPCCNIIARDITKNIVIARDNATGRLYQFKADAMDIKIIQKGDAVNISAGKVTSISGATRTYLNERKSRTAVS